MSVGIGYDSHRFEAGRPLVLGGVEIPFEKGLLGHSDGDVLTHAICDALLGGAGLPDLGTLYPPGDPATAGMQSLKFLIDIKRRVETRWLDVINVDAVIITEQPLLSPYFPEMKKALNSVLHIGTDRIGLKAKTNEGMGFVGRGEGIVVYAVAMLGKD